MELLTQTEPVVATLFAEFEFAEMVPVPPDTAAYEGFGLAETLFLQMPQISPNIVFLWVNGPQTSARSTEFACLNLESSCLLSAYFALYLGGQEGSAQSCLH